MNTYDSCRDEEIEKLIADLKANEIAVAKWKKLHKIQHKAAQKYHDELAKCQGKCAKKSNQLIAVRGMLEDTENELIELKNNIRIALNEFDANVALKNIEKLLK